MNHGPHCIPPDEIGDPGMCCCNGDADEQWIEATTELERLKNDVCQNCETCPTCLGSGDGRGYYLDGSPRECGQCNGEGVIHNGYEHIIDMDSDDDE